MLDEKITQYSTNLDTNLEKEDSTDFENAFNNTFSTGEAINSSGQNDDDILERNRYERQPTTPKKVRSIFKIEKKEEEKKFLGRKRDKDKTNFDSNSKKIHDNTGSDNLLNKIQVHAINSIGDITNSILDYFHHIKEERFLYTSAEMKKKINKKEFKMIKEKKICEILASDISRKYSKVSKDHNKVLYNSFEEKSNIDPMCKVLIKFLDQDFLTFFKNVYHKKARNINLQNYGHDVLVPLSEKVQLCDDKLKTFKDEEYIKHYKKCINDYYFDGKLIEFQMEKQI